MAGGDHRAGDVQEAAGVVHQVGRPEPAADDVGALARAAAGDRVGERLAGAACRGADDELSGVGRPRERGADRLGAASSSWSGTTPRTSYGFKICSRSLNVAPLVSRRMLPPAGKSVQDQTYWSCQTGLASSGCFPCPRCRNRPGYGRKPLAGLPRWLVFGLNSGG